MALHDWFVNPQASGGGDGSKANPFRTLLEVDKAIKVVNNDIHRVHLKTGAVLHERVPLHLTQAQLGLYMDVYGGSEPATFDITTEANFTLDANKDWYTAKLGTKDWGDKANWLTIGAVFEDGVVMHMHMYDKDHTKLRAAMKPGEYSYDMISGMVYMVPSDKGQHKYRASTASQILSLDRPGPFWDQNKHENDAMRNRTFEGIVFKGAKRHAVEVFGAVSKSSFRECGFYGIGGQPFEENNNHYLGNGIEIGGQASIVEVKKCWFDQIFDSGATTQVYAADEKCFDVIFEDNEFTHCGLSGIEIATQYGGGSSTTLYDITARFNRIKSNKEGCFAPEIYHGRFNGFIVIYNAAGSTFKNVVIQKNLIEDQRYNAFNVSGCDGLVIADNEIKRCDLGIFHGIGRDQANSLDFRQNRILECGTGIRTNSGIDKGTATFRDNVVEGGDEAYSDGSPVNYNVVLTNNVLNAKKAVAASRTQDITGSGNTSTGEIDTKYRYLF